jgi:hypothetical protein
MQRETPTNVFQFGNRTITTKVYMVTRPEPTP